MKNTGYAFIILFLVMTLLWLLADGIVGTKYEFLSWRASFINYTGIIGMGAMSIAMMLGSDRSGLNPLSEDSTKRTVYTSGACKQASSRRREFLRPR